jgi:mycothiol synthase
LSLIICPYVPSIVGRSTATYLAARGTTTGSVEPSVNQYVESVARHASLPGAPIEVARSLAEVDVGAVHEIVSAAAERDGVTPLHEHAMLQVTTEPVDAVTHLLARPDARVVGYAQLDQRDRAAPRLECVVAPDARRQGWGRALVERGRALVSPRQLELWSHGDQPAAAALAERLGFSRVRALWLMRRDLDTELPPVPSVEPPLRIRTFRPGEDEDAWLTLNARAFADHPEQGQTTRADLARRMGQSWFDPKGFFLAERDDRLVGFHWTKVHAADPPVGEVYVVGVDPDTQGSGLGRTLTLVGLHYLRDRGLQSVVLYVEATNAPAIAVYSRLGFVHADTDVMYRG